MRQRCHICVCVALLFVMGGFFASAQNDREESAQNDSANVQNDRTGGRNDRTNVHSLGVNLRPSYVMPTHGFYRGWNPQYRQISFGGTIDLQYSFTNKGQGAYQGAGVALHTFFAGDMLGTPTTIYAFQGAPLALLTDNLSIGYEWNLGLSAGWKNNGLVTVSPLNAYINVAALFTWRVSPHWDILFGPEYTHFSNGDTAFPNGGANTINFRIGARRHFQRTEEIVTERIFTRNNQRAGFWKNVSYDLALLGGWRADRSFVDGKLEINNKAFPLAGLHFTPLYHFNSYLGLGPSIDFQYDNSANREYLNGLMQSACGLSARFELKMPVFAVNVGIGYGFQLGHRSGYSDNELEGVYGAFGLKAFVTKRLFFNLNYRLGTIPYSHNLMYGLGWRFGYIKG